MCPNLQELEIGSIDDYDYEKDWVEYHDSENDESDDDSSNNDATENVVLEELAIDGLEDSDNAELNFAEEEPCIVPTLKKLKYNFSNGQDLNLVLKMFPGLRELVIENNEDGDLMNQLSNTNHPTLMT